MKFATKYDVNDYIGQRFGKLVVVGPYDDLKKDGSKQWEFLCDCGTTVIDAPYRVLSGHKRSCGCMGHTRKGVKNSSNENCKRVFAEDYIGQSNNNLTVIGLERSPDGGRAKLKCLCSCGNVTYVYPYQFTSGCVKSCGCLKGGLKGPHSWDSNRKTHGLTKDKFYKKWNDMVRRCHDPKEPAFEKYGARGITVCEEWRYSPEKFIEWCHLTHPGDPSLTIDRIDGSKGYSPENCRWATMKEQSHNLRTNRNVTINGETKCVAEWCFYFGIYAQSVYKRVKSGMSFEDAILYFANKRKAAP